MKTETLVKRLFNCPTAPFKEDFVLDEIRQILKENKIPFFTDAHGNIVAGKKTKKDLPKKPYFVFMAHTDHPGFHITKKVSRDTYNALWFGGAPFKQMKGRRVRIYSENPSTPSRVGVVLEIEQSPYKRTGMEMSIRSKAELNVGDFGSFYFPGCVIRKNKVITRCADDLAGCVMALGALIDLKNSKTPAVAVFTRAEEVGFVGAFGLLKQKVLNPKYARAISLEASKTLPGAIVHQGPVVRMGDASTIFNARMNRFMTMTAQDLSKKDKTFKFQRRVMDGGSCEATAFDLFGFQTMGLCVPLINYHNQGKTGPAPEIISLLDVDNGRKLLAEIGRNHRNFGKPTKMAFERINEQFKKLKHRL